ncbi:MAG TPA: GNAT family N-acetyltransferase [Verrucomicrobiae bacterium]|nr:GNAT family N-acetyltransferase [Verrucomicrobiae bacterium]
MALGPARADIGAHVDYPTFPSDGSAQNYSLVFALPFNTLVAGRKKKTGSDVVSLYAADYKKKFEFKISELEAKAKDTAYVEELRRKNPWAGYALGIFYTAKKRGYKLGGAEFTITGDVPKGAGLASSASYMTAMTLAGIRLFGWPLDPAHATWNVAHFAREAEHADYSPFVGAKPGHLDHIASLAAVKDAAVILNYGNLEDLKTLRFDMDGYRLVIVDTTLSHYQADRAEAIFNERVDELNRAVPVMNRLLGLEAAPRLHVSAFTFDEFKSIESRFMAEEPILAKRVRYVLTERERTIKAITALREDRIKDVVPLLDESSQALSMDGDYQLTGTVPGKGRFFDALVEIGREPGIAAGRMIGRGGAGTALFIVRKDRLAEWSEKLVRDFEARMGIKVQVHEVSPSDGARVIWDKNQTKTELRTAEPVRPELRNPFDDLTKPPRPRDLIQQAGVFLSVPSDEKILAWGAAAGLHIKQEIYAEYAHNLNLVLPYLEAMVRYLLRRAKLEPELQFVFMMRDADLMGDAMLSVVRGTPLEGRVIFMPYSKALYVRESHPEERLLAYLGGYVDIPAVFTTSRSSRKRYMFLDIGWIGSAYLHINELFAKYSRAQRTTVPVDAVEGRLIYSSQDLFPEIPFGAALNRHEKTEFHFPPERPVSGVDGIREALAIALQRMPKFTGDYVLRRKGSAWGAVPLVPDKYVLPHVTNIKGHESPVHPLAAVLLQAALVRYFLGRRGALLAENFPEFAPHAELRAEEKPPVPEEAGSAIRFKLWADPRKILYDDARISARDPGVDFLTEDEGEALFAEWKFFDRYDSLKNPGAVWHETGNFMIAYQDGKPVGAYGFVAHPEDNWVRGNGIGVDAAVRRSGIGTRLRERLLGYLKEAGYEFFEIGSTDERFDLRIGADDAAQQFHEDFLRETPAEAIAKVARDRDGKLKGILVDLKHYPAPRGELRAEEEPAAEKPASQVDEAAQAQAAEEMKKVDARPMFGRVSPTVSTDGWYYRWPSFSIPNWTWLRRFIFFRMARAHLYVMAMGVDEQTARRVIESIALVAPLKVRIRRDIWKFEITGWAPYWLRAWASDAEGDPDAAMKIRKYYIALQFLIPGNEQYHRLEQKLDAEYAAGRLADYRAHGIEAPEIRKIEIPYETPIPAYLILPANHEPGKKIPVVQIHHGFTNRKENPYFDSIERGLVQRGIAVLRSDLIGHGGQTLPLISTGKINAYLNAVTRYLEKYPGLDPERIGYFGFSFGGYMGLRALSNVSLGRRLKAVAVENPPVADTFMNYRRVLHHSRDYLEYLFNVTQLADLRLRLRLLSLSRSERRLNVLRERRDRLLVFTSGKDQVITRRDYRWLKNVLGPMLANGRDAVVAYPREDHHIFYERQDMEARVFRHFEQLLLGQEQARPAAKPELRPSALALGREKQLRPRRPELRASLGPESVGPEAEDVFFRSWNMGTEMPKAVADRFRALIPRELLAHLGHPRRKPLKVYTWGTEKEDEAWGLFVQAAGDGEITVRLAQSFGEISDYLFDRENRRLKAEITLIAEGKKLVIGFPGRIEAFPEALQIGPHLSKGEKVFQWWVDNILVPWADKLGFEELEIMQGPLSDDGLWSAGFMPRSRFLRRPARPSDELIWNRRVRPGTKSELRTGQEQPRENFFNRNQAFFRELAIAAAVIAAFGWLSVHYFLPLSREWTQKSPLYFFLFSGVLTLVRAVLAAVIGVRFERKVLNENKPSFERNVRRTVLSLVFNMPVFGFFIFGWLLKMIPGFWVFPAAVVQGVTAQIFLAPFLFDPMNYILGRVFVEKRTFRQAVDDARHNLPGFSFWALVIWLPGHILAFALPDAIGTYIVQGIVTMVWGVVAFILTGRERIEVIAHLREWLKQRFPSLFHPESRIRRLGHFFMRPLLAFYGLSGLGLIAMTTAYGFYVSFLALLGFTIQADVVLSLEILGAGVLFWPAIYVGYRHLMREPAPPPAEGTRAELRTSSPEDFLSAGLKEARPELRTSAPARFYVKPSLALPTRPRGFVSSPPQLTFKFLFSEEKAEFPVLTRQEREALKAAGGWEFLGGVPEIASVNWLIAYEGTRPVGVYAFDAFDSEIVRGKGIYILPEHRRRHIGELLRLYLYDHLKKRGSKYFKVGVTFDHGIGGILKTREAQRFQRSLIAKVAPKAVEGITFYRNSGELQGLTVDLQKFRMPARLPPLRPRTTIYTMRSLSVRKMVMASYRRSELRDLARQVLEVLAAEKALPQPVADRVGKTAAADMDALAQTLAEEAPSLAPRYVSARRNENSLRLIAAGRRLREQHPAWGEDLRVFSRTSAALLGTRYREVLRADPRQKLAFAFAQRLPASVEGRSSFADYLKMIKALQGEFPGRIRAEFRVMASADEIAGEGARDYFRELERTGLVKILNLSSPDAAFLLDEFLRVHGNALVFGLADSALAPGEDLRFVRSDVDAEALLPVAFLLSAHLARDPLSKITAELLKQIPPLLGGLVRYHGRSLEVTPLVLEMAYKFQASELVAQMA